MFVCVFCHCFSYFDRSNEPKIIRCRCRRFLITVKDESSLAFNRRLAHVEKKVCGDFADLPTFLTTLTRRVHPDLCQTMTYVSSYLFILALALKQSKSNHYAKIEGEEKKQRFALKKSKEQWNGKPKMIVTNNLGRASTSVTIRQNAFAETLLSRLERIDRNRKTAKMTSHQMMTPFFFVSSVCFFSNFDASFNET